jgi:phage terminase large subunit-like protein
MLKFANLALLYPGFQGIIFRRTRPELVKPGGLWSQSWKIFRPLGFVPREGNLLDWRHPNGSVIKFDHMQLERDMYNHQGPSYHGVGFDECTHFTEAQFWYLLGRLREGPLHLCLSGVRLIPVMCATMNPDPDSFVKGIIDWWLDENKQFADSEKSGKLRWLLRRNGELVWGNTPEEMPCEDEQDRPKSVTFFPSALSDNKILEQNDPTYRANLRLQLPHERARLERGDWSIRAAAGDYFQRGMFRAWGMTELDRKMRGQPLARDLVACVRAWDLAATPVKGDLVRGVPRPDDFVALEAGERNPDWTRGVKLGKFKNGDMVVLDMASCRDTPGAVDKLQERTADDDGPQCVIHIPQDPGQAGIDQAESRKRELRRFARVESRARSKNKEFYARGVSRFCFSGRMWYLPGPYAITFFNDIEKFPPENLKVHDDVVDAFADAFDFLYEVKTQFGYTPVKDYDILKLPHDESTDVRVNAGFRRGELL